MNNVPYEKTIESVARRTDIRLMTDMEKARKLDEKPQCVDFRLFDGQCVAGEAGGSRGRGRATVAGIDSGN